MTPNSTSLCRENRTRMKIVSGARSTAPDPDHDPRSESASQERRGTDEATAEAKRDQFFLKQARKKDSEKALKCQSGSEEQLEMSDKGRDRLSEDAEERHRRKDKKSSRPRSLSRSRSREKRHHNRNWDKKRSRSRSGERRSRSRDKKRRARSRSNSRGKHRHRSRSRSKSREKKKRSEKARRKSRSRSVSPVTFRGRNTAMDAQEALARRLERAKKLQEQKEKEFISTVVRYGQRSTQSRPERGSAARLRHAGHSSDRDGRSDGSASGQNTGRDGHCCAKLLQSLSGEPHEVCRAGEEEENVVAGEKEGDKSQTAELWEKLNFGNKDQNVKFRKLMGIKGEEEGCSSGAANEEGLKTLQQQEEMFRNLDVQYEMARSQTHTQRGMGLGFSSSFSSRGMDAV
ncbi:Arginine/serine-rich coiled-coil protein 2 [Labeo rohita]|uniref:Arginine/serine-rich coiled-coil protein 2 n=1 Tax=Labeo rohita TaxID=84645 RepID=A0ABQ8MMC9_LABRO|nr:Arginine/serine-rich coiled-coil protein 2 [Labeo rohita]